MPSIHIRVPGGTIKLKTYRRLSDMEKSGQVPVWKIGRWRLVWWSNRAKTRPVDKNRQDGDQDEALRHRDFAGG